MNIICSNAEFKLKEFDNGGPDEGIIVLGLSRDSSKTQYILQMESNVGREVIIEKNKWPTCVLAPTKGRETVCR
jgi:hypothetical protein